MHLRQVFNEMSLPDLDALLGPTAPLCLPKIHLRKSSGACVSDFATSCELINPVSDPTAAECLGLPLCA